MEELGRLFPALIIFLVLGVPPIVYLFNKLIEEKEKRIGDIKTLTAEFQQTIEKVEATHSGNDNKLLDGINGVKSIAEKLLDRSKNV